MAVWELRYLLRLGFLRLSLLFFHKGDRPQELSFALEDWGAAPRGVGGAD